MRLHGSACIYDAPAGEAVEVIRANGCVYEALPAQMLESIHLRDVCHGDVFALEGIDRVRFYHVAGYDVRGYVCMPVNRVCVLPHQGEFDDYCLRFAE